MSESRAHKSTPSLRLRVTAAAESIVRSGHPWLFAESIREQNRAGEPSELAVIYDRNDKFLAIGLYDRESPIRVRILHTGKPETLNREWWSARLAQAIARRQELLDDQTTGYRWINGESDGWPGLVLDRYGTTLVLKLYTIAWLPFLNQTVELIEQQLKPERLVLRLSRNIQSVARAKFNQSDGDILRGKPPSEPVVFLESGLKFEADVLRGQKTGFFLDQRENRRRVETLAAGGNVLNAFSFSGGFSLYAARGGAHSVTDLDISAHALKSARKNFELNQSHPAIDACRHEQVHADAFEWLAQTANPKFDVVILDPPSLARRESERAGAIRAYGKLAASGIAHLSRGGVLVACSCSAHVNSEEFFGAVRTAANESGRDYKEMQTTTHAPDHPAEFPEAHYLKTIFVQC